MDSDTSTAKRRPSWRQRLFQPAWLQEGINPDYRFTLANERTFLAWLRTALALVAAAVVVHQLGSVSLKGQALSHWAAIGLALLAMVLSGSAYGRWRRYEIAMRTGQPLPAGLGLQPAAWLVSGLAFATLGWLAGSLR